ncbi:MAG: AI-2E family transporter [Candidatus Altiarchaeota archaeon]
MDLKKTYATILIVALSAFILYALTPYVDAFFGAIILYTVFHPLYDRLNQRWNMSKGTSAILVIIFSIFIITLPFLYIMGLLVDEASSITSQFSLLPLWLESANRLVPEINIGDLIGEQMAKAGEYIKAQILSMVLGLTLTLINITIMYFLLYYMLVNHRELPKMALAVSPFNEKNTRRLAQEVSGVTYGTIVAQGAVGILHGILLGFGLHVFGISHAIFWGFLSAVLSMLPTFGTPLVWIPAGIYQISSGQVYSGIGILIWGAILTNLDSILRPLMQARFSQIHPLISLIGFFIGVNYFGVIGIIVGPLLLSYFFLMFEMFKEEYLNPEDGDPHRSVKNVIPA